MSDTPSRTFSRFAGRALRLTLYLALGGIIVFFALTRTEVGRDGVRRQIQSVFNERFAGSLHIGSLQGTLLNELRATDIRLRDQNGQLVATIDSLATQPRWKHLFTAELSVQSLTLVRPRLTLHRNTDGVWNVEEALRTQDSSSSERTFDLSLTNVEVRNASITTSRSGAAPEPVRSNWLFDFSRSAVDSLYTGLSLKWTDPERRINLHSLHFQLPQQDLTFRSDGAEMVSNRSQWRFNPFSFQLGNTEVKAEGTLQPSPRNPDRPVLDIQVAESRLDHDELMRIVPRLPLRDEVVVEGRLGGNLHRFVVNELTVSHRASEVSLEGTAFGLPDSLNVDAQILNSRIRPSDLHAVWPGAPLDRTERFGAVELGASVRGLVEWKGQRRATFDLEGDVSAQGSPGAVQGSLDVKRSLTRPASYTGHLKVDSLNLAPIIGSPQLDSRLTGRVSIEGSGATRSSLKGELRASLTTARVGLRRFAGGTLQVQREQQRTDANLALRQIDGGTLTAQGSLDQSDSIPRYNVFAAVTGFNLSTIHPPFPTSRVNATLTIDGSGFSPEEVVGEMEVAVDSSNLQRGDQTLPLSPHTVRLALTPPSSSEPRIQLGGTLASGSIEGRPLHPAVLSASRLWAQTLRNSYRRERIRTTQNHEDTTSVPSDAVPQDAYRRAQEVFATTGSEPPVNLVADLSVHEMDLVRRWWPKAPTRSEGFRTTAQLEIGPDTLSAAGSLRASYLLMDSRAADDLEASYHFSSPLRPDLLDSATASLSAQADTLRLGRRELIRTSANVAVSKRTGTFEATADELGRTGPFRIASDLTLDEGLHVKLRDLFAGMGQSSWQLEDYGTLGIYTDAVVVDSLSLESPRTLTDGTQHVDLKGTISAASSDTLYAEMTDVLLYPVGELMSLPRSLGGRLNGSVAVTGDWNQPQIQSSFDIHRLTFDRRVLGDLRVQTRLLPDTPDLIVDAALTPGPSSLSELTGPNLVPEGPRVIEENELTVDGRVRLPGIAEDMPYATAAEQLDLNVDVRRADLFFFKYIFDENLTRARGYTAGRIHVGGRFRRPIFDADLRIEDGRFTLPQFGLAYSASGPVDVDRRGIHLQDLSVTDDDGSAVVNGSILFNEYRYFSFDLSAQLDELTIIDVNDAEDLAFYGDIRASGPASLTGPLQNATLRSERAETTPDSELYIPVSEGGVEDGTGFIVFADSTGQIPDLRDLTRRDNILSDRPAGEPSFLEGLEIDINVVAPEESTVNLVFDPVVGDVVTAVGSGRIQLQRQEGEFFVYGNFAVSGGTYLFTAGEVFVRRFNINGGTITWDGHPTNALLDLEAEYRTRASQAGLPGYDGNEGRIPVRVLLDIGGRVETPRVELSLARVRDEHNNLVGSQTLDAILNQPDRTTEYATSVLLTNTFLLTTESFTEGRSTSTDGSTSGNLATAGNQLAFNSVSQLVASQLNRYLGAALPNVDLNFGLQGENPSDLDLIYGVALRLLNERLVIRGEGVYTGDDPSNRQAEGPQGEFVVEVRLSNRVRVEAFYRRTGDELTQGQTLTSSTGAGFSYQTEFPTWRKLFGRVFGWLIPGLIQDEPPPSQQGEPDPRPDPVARTEDSNSGPPESTEDAPDG